MKNTPAPPNATPMFCARVRVEQPDNAAGRAIADIAAERRRQIEVEGWTPAHDDEHDRGELADAAAAYAIGPGRFPFSVGVVENPRQSPPLMWPWILRWWKPSDRRRDLVKAGALIVAEIERLDRADPPASDKP